MNAKTGLSAKVAERIAAIVEGGGAGVREETSRLVDGGTQASAAAARVLVGVAEQDAALLNPVIPSLVAALCGSKKRAVETAAAVLPLLVKVSPARVAKHATKLVEAFPTLGPPGQDGVVRTFAAMCLASVAYQRRLEPTLRAALADADPKVLVGWCEVVLPVLKGEPYANLREVAEARLRTLPKAQGKKLAAILGVRWVG